MSEGEAAKAIGTGIGGEGPDVLQDGYDMHSNDLRRAQGVEICGCGGTVEAVFSEFRAVWSAKQRECRSQMLAHGTGLKIDFLHNS